MKSQDNFQIQIEWMRDILVSNTTIAENINQLLKKIDPQVLAQCVDVVIEQYQKKYPWTLLRAQEQVDKLKSIKKALYLAKREQITNIDELNLKLADEINQYYGRQHIQPKKQLPFSLKCKKCEKYVSNYQLGLKNHQLTCRKENQNVSKQKANHIDCKSKINQSKNQASVDQSKQQLVSSKKQRLNRKKKQKQQDIQEILNDQNAIEFERGSRQINNKVQQMHNGSSSQKNQADDKINYIQSRKYQNTSRKDRHQCIQPVIVSSDQQK